MTEIHITADKDVWTSASTTAMLCAARSGGIVISAGDEDILRRFSRSGVEVVSCPMKGIFASLNLSRALRHVPGDGFAVFVHSPAILKTVERAVQLVGRPEPITVQAAEMPEFPTVNVEKGENLIMWLGNITENCGLRELIEDFAANENKSLHLRVVGQGKASVVSPVLKRTKALGISDRIEWVGYSDNPYKEMNGVSAAIVRDLNCVAAREFAAASIPVYTKLSEIS